VLHLDAGIFHAHPEVQHRRSLLRVVVDARYREEVPRGRAAAEDLAPAEAVRAVRLGERARAVEPVGATAGDEYELLRRDAPEQRLGRGNGVLAIAPDQPLQEVRVHGVGERRRATPTGDDADDRGVVGVRRAATAELGGYGRREELRLAQRGVVLRHEAVVGVVLGGPRREVLRELLGDAEAVGRLFGR